jgi:hypothetical protein
MTPMLAGTPQVIDAVYVIVIGPSISPAPTIGSEGEMVQHEEWGAVPMMEDVHWFEISTSVDAPVRGLA